MTASTKLDRLEAAVRSKFPQLTVERLSDAVVLRVETSRLLETMTCLRDDPEFDFKLLVDLCGVHYLDNAVEGETGSHRFEVVYQLLSVYLNHRLRVKVSLTGEHPVVPSVIPVWKSANWYERETYEMFGILFANHPDLRRLLTDYDFEGYPLRKDFPLSGLVEVRYDKEQKRVVREPIRLERDSREYYNPADLM